MTTINNFSPARFWSVTTRDAALNWKTHLAHLLELAGTLLAGLLIIIITAKTHESTSFVSIADTFYSWFALVLTMGGMIAASTVLNPISDKPGSTEFLTLPATNVEKFLSRVTIVTLGFALSALVSLVAVGALYYLLAAIFGLDAYGSLTFYCLKVLFTPAQMIEGPAREAWSWQGTLASYGFFGMSAVNVYARRIGLAQIPSCQDTRRCGGISHHSPSDSCAFQLSPTNPFRACRHIPHNSCHHRQHTACDCHNQRAAVILAVYAQTSS